jgi:hypothetical protein
LLLDPSPAAAQYESYSATKRTRQSGETHAN